MKRTIQYQLSVIILMGLILALTACVRPAPSSEGVDVAATSAAATATAATFSTVAPLPTQPGGLVLPASPTPPPPVAPATNTPEAPAIQPTVAPSFTLPTTHTVQAGETLATISAIYGVPAAEIQAANGIVDPNALTVGQVLTIPVAGTTGQTAPPATTGGGTQPYVVQPGDNLFRIGINHGGYTAAELAAYNGIPNPTLIFPGQVIQFPPR